MRYADCEVLHALDGWVVDCQADSCALYATQVPKLDDAVALAEDHSCPITMESASAGAASEIPDGDHYGMGRCAVCGLACEYGYLMCPEHWRQVPAALKSRVYRTLRSWEAGRGELLHLRCAQADAVGAVVS